MQKNFENATNFCSTTASEKFHTHKKNLLFFFRMSLEYYTRNGIILPIGLAVCGLCRDKHLRSVDLSNSRIIPSISPAEIIVPDSNTSPVSVLPTKRELSTSPNSPELLSLNITNNACPAASAPLPKMRQLSTSSSKVTSTNGDVQVQLVAMSPPQDRIKLGMFL